ncbi:MULTISPECIES: ferredoxin [unclassified Pseudonocardia]|uniref:ferredoxin n=1 Tax=unclassified Pseudonocardia TaxID=2619320 RepID=UPI0003047FB1|nr:MULTISPECIES: ferredoxin [unclassified Pseudonocardia]OLM32939.1 putative ferredoxin FdxD [Pseudonocardia sp. Ae717_Ps2]
MSTELTVDVDRNTCAGHGRCYSLAPEVFDADDEGFPVLLAANVSGAAADEARTAARNCPERAVLLDHPTS